MPRNKKSSNKIIISMVIIGAIVVIGSSFGIYLYLHGTSHKQTFMRYGKNFRGNFIFNNEILNQTSDLFNNNSNTQTTQSYCQQNMVYCRYYCMKINPENKLCNQLQFPMMNYSIDGETQ